MTDEEFISWLRFFLANLSTDIISDADLQIILDQVKTQYPEASDCRIKYEFAVETLNHLIRKGSVEEGANGELRSRLEKNGQRSIKIEYNSGSTDGTLSGWESILANLQADPDSVGCVVFPPVEGVVSSGIVIIGGQDVPRYSTASPWLKSTQIRKTGFLN